MGYRAYRAVLAFSALRYGPSGLLRTGGWISKKPRASLPCGVAVHTPQGFYSRRETCLRVRTGR